MRGIKHGPIQINPCREQMALRTVNSVWRLEEIRPYGFRGCVHPALLEKSLHGLKKAEVIHGHAVTEHIHEDRIRLLRKLPENTELHRREMNILRDFFCYAQGEHLIRLKDIRSELLFDIVNDNENIKIAFLNVTRARLAAKQHDAHD